MKNKAIEVHSRIHAATVYHGRAMISRTFNIHLEPGHHQLILTDLPSTLDQNSFQVKGTGEVTIGDCTFETKFYTEEVNEKERLLLIKKRELENHLEDTANKTAAYDKDKQFVEKIANFVTSGPDNSRENEDKEPFNGNGFLDVVRWEKMLAFYHQQHMEIGRKTIENARTARKLEKELETLKNQIDAMDTQGERSRFTVKINVSKETVGDVTLEISYLVSGPDWRPAYRFRAASESDTLFVEYEALVHQGTGEDWEDVDLKLSTARIDISGTMPELFPWRICLAEPAIERDLLRKRKSAADDAILCAAPAASALEPEMTVEPDAAYRSAGIENSRTAALFSIDGGGGITGDNQGTRVTILRRPLPAVFKYQAVPKLAERAYLTATVKNETDYPFLPGKVNVFFDGALVSTSEIELIMPDQEMDVSLGVDEGVQVEYRFLKRFKKNQGIMSKRISEQFDYQIRVTNNRKKAIAMTVCDQLPIAENKEITVKAISPDLKNSHPEITRDDEFKIQWRIDLPAGEKRELPLSFLIEYPMESKLSGL